MGNSRLNSRRSSRFRSFFLSFFFSFFLFVLLRHQKQKIFPTSTWRFEKSWQRLSSVRPDSSGTTPLALRQFTSGHQRSSGAFHWRILLTSTVLWKRFLHLSSAPSL